MNTLKFSTRNWEENIQTRECRQKGGRLESRRNGWVGAVEGAAQHSSSLDKLAASPHLTASQLHTPAFPLYMLQLRKPHLLTMPPKLLWARCTALSISWTNCSGPILIWCWSEVGSWWER